MQQLRERFRGAAMDLPGIARSRGHPQRGDKRTLAGHVHSVARTARLGPVSLVGHDIGGQIVYAFLRAFPGVAARAVILNVVIRASRPAAKTSAAPASGILAFTPCRSCRSCWSQGIRGATSISFFDAIAADPARISTDS